MKYRQQINMQKSAESIRATSVALAGEGSPEDLAGPVLTILRWDWLDPSFSVEARRVLPILLLELFFAEREGRRISKKEACDIMGVDSAKTGPKYIAQAKDKGLILVDHKPEEDRRKDFLRATPRLIELISTELTALYHEIDRRRGRSSIVSSPAHNFG